MIGDSLKVHFVKMYRLADGRLYGGSGTADDVLAVLAWLNEGGDKPTVEHFAALLIDTEGQCARLEGGLRPMPIREPFHSVGSGRDFAIAAMALGKTAADAVALAMQFDPWTGGDVQTLRLPLVKPTELEDLALTATELKDLEAYRRHQGMMPWNDRGTPYAPR